MAQCAIWENGRQCRDEAAFWITCRKHTPPSLLPPGPGGPPRQDPPPPPNPNSGGGGGADWLKIAKTVSAVASGAGTLWKIIGPHIPHIIHHIMYDPAVIQAEADDVARLVSEFEANNLDAGGILKLQTASAALLQSCTGVMAELQRATGGFEIAGTTVKIGSDVVRVTRILQEGPVDQDAVMDTRSVFGDTDSVGKVAPSTEQEAEGQPANAARSMTAGH